MAIQTPYHLTVIASVIGMNKSVQALNLKKPRLRPRHDRWILYQLLSNQSQQNKICVIKVGCTSSAQKRVEEHQMTFKKKHFALIGFSFMNWILVSQISLLSHSPASDSLIRPLPPQIRQHLF